MSSSDSGGDNLDDLFENAPCGYVLLDPRGRLVRANLTFCTLTGFSHDELAGRRFSELLNIAGRMFYETHFAPLLRMQGFFNEVALDLVTKSGTRLAVLANATEKRNVDQQLLGIRVALFVAAERRRHERELIDTKASLEAANQALAQQRDIERNTGELRDQFIAVLGHDLRNPLASVHAGLQVLLRRLKDEQNQKMVMMMLASAERMGGLINNVLDFARGRLGGGLSLVPVADRPIAPTLELVVAELQASHPTREIAFEYDLPVPVAVDHARLAQLFSNLLGNAVTHGDPGQAIRIMATSDEHLFELTVTNGGAPITVEAMGRLFEPFSRGTDPSNQQGLGLGLYIASQIAIAHGGRIDVISNERQTSFTFRMPSVGRNEG